jgi:hypothetical protein
VSQGINFHEVVFGLLRPEPSVSFQAIKDVWQMRVTPQQKTGLLLLPAEVAAWARNTALNLARRGVDIIFSYRANRPEAEPLIRKIEELGRKAVAFQL